MNRRLWFFILALIAIVAAAVILTKPAPQPVEAKKPHPKQLVAESTKKPSPAITIMPAKKTKYPAKKSVAMVEALPRLLDLGADKCVPCKMMIPVLDELKQEYKGKLKVEFIDVWENREAGDKYKIQSIPTQIFFDKNGKEIYRHMGYFPKADIISTFEEHGVKLK